MSNNNISLHQVTQGVAYLDGKTLLGKTESFELPNVEFVFQQLKAMGMVGEIELPTMGVKKMTGKVKFNSYYPSAMRKMNPFVYRQLQVRSSVQEHNNAGLVRQVPLVTILTVAFKKIPTSKVGQHENQEFETDFACTYIKQMYDGESVFEYDAIANIFKINDEDVLAEYKANVM